MNRSVYEGKFLLNLVGATLRQDDSFPVMRRMNWGRLYRIADYHELSSAVYLGMLSAGARVPALFGERFFSRYQEAVRYGAVYESSELEILDAFQALKIPAVILESAAVRRLYPLAETAANSPLRLFIPEEKYPLAKGYLVDLGYERDDFYKGFGERMKRIGGFQVEIYHSLPFLTKGYKNCMKGFLDRAFPDKNRPVLKSLSLESSYLFRLAEASYHFCTDSLKVRELLDLYLFYKLFYKDMNQRYLDLRIKELRIPLLSKSLLQMAEMWFGSRKESLFSYPKDSISLFDDMEARILSNGTVGADSIPEAAKLRKAIRDAENREEKAVKWRKWREKWADRFRALGRKIRWAFPDKKYMASLYPELEHRVYLLPIYWIKRDFHLLLVLFRAEKGTEGSGITAKTAEEAETKKQEEIAGQYSAFRSFRGGRENAITDIGYQDDPFRTNGRKKVFYKERQKEEKKEFASQITNEEKKEFTDKLTAEERNSTISIPNIRKEDFEEKKSEEEELLPLNKDFAFLSEEIDENEKTDEAEEEKESEWNLWNFSAPRTSVPEYDSLRRQVSDVSGKERDSSEGSASNQGFFGKLSREEEERALNMLAELLGKDGAPTLTEEELRENVKAVEARYREKLEGEKNPSQEAEDEELFFPEKEEKKVSVPQWKREKRGDETSEKKQKPEEEYATLDGKEVKVQSWVFPKAKKEEE